VDGEICEIDDGRIVNMGKLDMDIIATVQYAHRESNAIQQIPNRLNSVMLQNISTLR